MMITIDNEYFQNFTQQNEHTKLLAELLQGKSLQFLPVTDGVKLFSLDKSDNTWKILAAVFFKNKGKTIYFVLAEDPILHQKIDSDKCYQTYNKKWLELTGSPQTIVRIFHRRLLQLLNEPQSSESQTNMSKMMKAYRV